MIKLRNKIKNNLKIYKNDLHSKGLYWSIIHRLYKISVLKKTLSPIVNFFKPSYVYINSDKFYINKSDISVSEGLLQYRVWEEYTTEIIKKHVKQGDNVIDLGAHIGYFTIMMAKLVGPEGKVYAFEPDKFNFELLKKNVNENNYKNVTLINAAVSDKTKKIKLFISNENSADHRIFKSEQNRSYSYVKAITLDDYFKKNKVKINFIKMDIQGSEVKALKGASKLLRARRIVKILTEFWPKGLQLSGYDGKYLLNMLNKYGFSIQELNEKNKKLESINTNIFLSKYGIGDDIYTNLICINNV